MTASPRRANRLWLYGPLAVFALILAGYFALWIYGSRIMRVELDNWIADQRAAGLAVTHGDIRMEGFPFVLRGRVMEPTLADPQAGWQWTAGRLYVDTLPYNPTRLILTPWGVQTLRVETDGDVENWKIDSDSLRASLAETALAVEGHKVELTPIETAGAEGVAKLTFGSLRFNGDILDDAATGMEGDILTVLAGLRNFRLEMADGTVTALPLANLDLRFTAANGLLAPPPNMSGLDAWRRGDGKLEVRLAEITLSTADVPAPSRFTAEGTLHTDSRDYPAGTLMISLKDPAALVSLLAEYGAISNKQADQISGVLSALGETTLPLEMADGKAMIPVPLAGKVKVADLPRLQ